jgi:hypothetical protein
MMRLIAVCGRITRWLTHNGFKQSLTNCVLRDISREALATFTTKRRLCQKLCNICGSNYTMDACRQKGFPDTNTDVSVLWSDSAVGKAWKDQHDCNLRPGGPTVTLGNYVRQGEQAKKKAAIPPHRRPHVNELSHFYRHVHGWTVSKWWCAVRNVRGRHYLLRIVRDRFVLITRSSR